MKIPEIFTKYFSASGRFLLVPVASGSPRVTIQLVLNGQMVREFNVELALAEPVSWWAFYDLSAFAGQALALEVVEGEIPSQARDWLDGALRLSDEPVGLEGLYREALRPQFHFSARRGWHNDPNGMVYHAGEWHLFFQHNPFGVGWGNMHWGHAVSRDLLHWEELPEALYQRSLKDMAFSGGGLVDWQNSAGFQSGSEPPLVVAFTSTGRGECLAYSNDHGRTLSEWEGSPFLAHHGRDPKIVWLEKTREWQLIVYEELEGPENPDPSQRGYAFYTSPDLKRWTRRSFLPGYYECPELFRLPLQGETAWVVYGARWEGAHSTCLIGDLDEGVFTARGENLTAHAGPNFYAAQAFSDAPDGRVILMGWMAGADFPDMPFSQAMSVPLELSLRPTPDGARLCFNPVRELEGLRCDTASAGGLDFAGASRFLAAHDSPLLDLELALEPSGPLALDIRGHRLAYDPAARALSFAGRSAILPEFSGPLALRVLVDRSVTEIFANAGLAAFAALTLFADPGQPVRLEGQGSAQINVHTLRSIW